MGKFFSKLLDVFDSLELMLIAILATVLFGSFVYYAWTGIKESGNTLASFSLLVIASATGLARDIYRKKFSGISITIISFWVLCAVYIFYKLNFT